MQASFRPEGSKSNEESLHRPIAFCHSSNPALRPTARRARAHSRRRPRAESQPGHRRPLARSLPPLRRDMAGQASPRAGVCHNPRRQALRRPAHRLLPPRLQRIPGPRSRLHRAARCHRHHRPPAPGTALRRAHAALAQRRPGGRAVQGVGDARQPVRGPAARPAPTRRAHILQHQSKTTTATSPASPRSPSPSRRS